MARRASPASAGNTKLPAARAEEGGDGRIFAILIAIYIPKHPTITLNSKP